MNNPAKFGAVIYSNDIQRLAQFYIDFLDMSRLKQSDELISLLKDGLNLVIHQPPCELPPQRLNTVKLIFTVEDLACATDAITSLGGRALAGEWSNPLFTLCNVLDPDGNPLQLRQFNASA